MRRPNLLLALMAGVLLIAFLPLDDAAAQDLDVEITSVELYMALADEAFRESRTAHQEGDCDTFEDERSTLRFHAGAVRSAQLFKALQKHHVAPEDITRAINHATLLLNQLDALGPCIERKSRLSISVGGGASSVWVPTIPIGTERRGGEEFAITETDDQLSGGSFNIEVTAPLSRTYSGYFNYQFTEADGSSSARVPEGDRLVAITFPVPNPATDTTGIGPSPFGININTHTDFEMNDIQFGFGAPVNFFGPSVVTTATIGGRYINVDRTDRIGQQLIQFPDLTQNIHVGQDTDFFGVQFGLDVENRPFQGSGFVYGASGSISFLANSNDAQVRSLVDCPPCTFPEDRHFTLRTALDEGPASLAVDGEVHLGYRFGDNVTIQVFASVTHFTDMPVVHLPVSPFDEFRVDESDFTNATVGAKAKFYIDFAGFDVLPRSRQ